MSMTKEELRPEEGLPEEERGEDYMIGRGDMSDTQRDQMCQAMLDLLALAERSLLTVKEVQVEVKKVQDLVLQALAEVAQMEQLLRDKRSDGDKGQRTSPF